MVMLQNNMHWLDSQLVQDHNSGQLRMPAEEVALQAQPTCLSYG